MKTKNLKTPPSLPLKEGEVTRHFDTPFDELRAAQCDGKRKQPRYFRNKFAFKFVEADSLWKLDDLGVLLILVDEDAYVYSKYEEHKEHFYEVEEPEELRRKK
jgi:hypothetical protein